MEKIETEIKTENLRELARIRAEIARLQEKAEAIEPDAVIEALEIMTNPDKKNQVVFSDPNAKIVLQYRKRTDTTPEIERLSEDIDREVQRLSKETLEQRQKLADYIAELQGLINEAQTQSNDLLNSPYLAKLRKQLSIARENAQYQIASLAVHVKEKRN